MRRPWLTKLCGELGKGTLLKVSRNACVSCGSNLEQLIRDTLSTIRFSRSYSLIVVRGVGRTISN